MPEKARRRKMQARLSREGGNRRRDDLLCESDARISGFYRQCFNSFQGGLHTCAMMECGTGSGKDGAQDMNEEAPYGYT